jgi:hypothetical protein
MRRIAVLACSLACLVPAASASATITPSRDADALADAIATPPTRTVITSASFPEIPPSGNPHALATSVLGGFPDDGSSYAILTTGDAELADDANTATNSGAGDGGAVGHGDPSNPDDTGNAYDTSILRINFTTPPGANCLSLGFRFYSEEYPEYVGDTVNDGFIAQLDGSQWWTASDGTITAPGNFAFDDEDAVISVNTSGASAEEAAGTTYDGATPKLSAAREVAPGAHSLYLSIFDQGDSSYDSAVFVDRLSFLTTAPGGCVRGAQSDETAPTVRVTSPFDHGATDDTTPVISGTAGNAPGDSSQVHLSLRSGATVLQNLTASRSGTAWSVEAGTLAPGDYTLQASQEDAAGNVGTSPLSTFTVNAPPPPPDNDTDTPDTPQPEQGKSVVAGKVSGTVLIRLKNGKFRKLGASKKIPLGSTIDATKGRVRLTSAAGGGKTQTADFYKGQFVITQTRRRRRSGACGATATGASAPRAVRRPPPCAAPSGSLRTGATAPRSRSSAGSSRSATW